MDSTTITKIVQLTIASVMLSILLDGGTINFKEKVNKTDLKYLAAAMELENGDNGDECLLLTGAVILNRVNSPKWKGDTVKEILYAKGQYAKHTVNNLKTCEPKERTIMLAKYLLIYGPQFVASENVVYQGQNKNAGSGVYRKIDVPGQKPEYFCYE